MIEYVMMFVIVIGAFLVMRSYIQRGIFSMPAQAGKGFAFGRQYDPQTTIECSYDAQSGLWYDYNCRKTTGGACLTTTCNAVNPGN